MTNRYSVRTVRAIYRDESDLALVAPDQPLAYRMGEETLRRGDDEITVEYHNYSIYGIYPRIGFRWTPAKKPITHLYGLWPGPIAPPYHPAQVDNITMPPPQALAQQTRELIALAGTYDVLIWEHFRHCYPIVARNIQTWFRHTISHFSDDCPQSALTKTDPVARFFHSAIHANIIFDRSTGKTTAQYYHEQGVADTHYLSIGASGGLMEELAAQRFDINTKVAQLAKGTRAPIDLVFVGPRSGAERQRLAQSIHRFRAAGLTVKFHGTNMPDGPVVFGGDVVKPRGILLAPIYAGSFAGVIPPVWGLAGTRLWDYWYTGVLVFVHDPVGELSHLGARAGEHFISYDGSIDGLIRSVIEWRQRPTDAARVIQAGAALAARLDKEQSVRAAIEKILFANLHKWRRA